jgi:phage N-6-adenine-methyltransferase
MSPRSKSSVRSKAYIQPSATVEWSTPQWLFDKLDAEFGFTLDAAASALNHKCPRYFTMADDALTQDWGQSVVWCNPPYGRGLGNWFDKAHIATLAGATVVMLVPSRTGTGWFHDYAIKHTVEYLKGRLKFGDASAGAPFDSIVVRMYPPPAP